jgi:transcriptional regulator with XRE-family HTH domain
MAADGLGPTVRRRRLGIELRRLREQAGMIGEEVAERMDWSATKVSRIETGQVSVHPGDVSDLLDLYGVGEQETRDALIAIARQARKKGWWHSYGDVLPQWFQVYIGLEAAAESLWNYQGQLVHGLLQTEDYARAAFQAAGFFTAPEEIDRGVELRMTRQRLLAKDPPLAPWAVLDEAALRRPVGGRQVMGRQLARLAEAADSPAVRLQVLPASAGAHAAMDFPFTVVRFPAGEGDVVYLESLTSALYLERAADVARYTLVFDHLRAAALSPKDSVALINTAAREL